MRRREKTQNTQEKPSNSLKVPEVRNSHGRETNLAPNAPQKTIRGGANYAKKATHNGGKTENRKVVYMN